MWSGFRASIKSRRDGSTTPDLVRVRTMRLDPETVKSDLIFEEVLTDTMDQVDGGSPAASHQGLQPSEIIDHGSVDNAAQLLATPVRDPTANSTPASSARRPGLDISSSPISLGAAGGESPSVGLTPPLQWSSAIGRATTGKSGRVIERIQAENDRLRRELKHEVLHREEEQKKSEMARAQLLSLQSTYDNLVQMRETEKASLARKERKVDDLKAECEAERSRRLEAESNVKESLRRYEQAESEMKAQLREEGEQAKRAVTQYDVLSSSWRHMDDDYRRKTDKLRADLTRLRLDSTEDRRKLQRLELVIEQQKQEINKMRSASDGFVRAFEAFKVEIEDGTRALKERAQQNEKANDEVLEEALRLVEQLKHVIHLGRCIRPTE